MSDENTGNAPSAEQTIPKARLDEVLAEKRRLEEQVQFQNQTLSQLVAQQQRAQRPQEEDSPELKELRETNPALYNQTKRQQREIKELRAAHFTQADENDRIKFILEAGDAGKKKLPEVERILDQERRAGRFHTRLGLYQWLEGQERLKRDAVAAARPAAPTEPVTEGDIPSSNPSSATTVKAGTATVKKVEKTREERIEELGDVVF
jgi:hypothetical protein